MATVWCRKELTACEDFDIQDKKRMVYFYLETTSPISFEEIFRK